jgi:hypothetical protein
MGSRASIDQAAERWLRPANQPVEMISVCLSCKATLAGAPPILLALIARGGENASKVDDVNSAMADCPYNYELRPELETRTTLLRVREFSGLAHQVR